MKRTGLIIFFSMLLLTKTWAQNSVSSILNKSYSHTINYAWGKAVFFLLAVEKNPNNTDFDKHYYWYSGNVLNNTQGGFSGRLLDGDYREYYTNKNLKIQGAFKAGVKTGRWTSWTEEGILISILNYKSGTIDGEFREYDLNGKISRLGKYKNGLLDGKLSSYSGDSVKIEKYSKGKIVIPKVSWVKKQFNKIFSHRKASSGNNKK